jgi:hypothetical protein
MQQLFVSREDRIRPPAGIIPLYHVVRKRVLPSKGFFDICGDSMAKADRGTLGDPELLQSRVDIRLPLVLVFEHEDAFHFWECQAPRFVDVVPEVSNLLQ